MLGKCWLKCCFKPASSLLWTRKVMAHHPLISGDGLSRRQLLKQSAMGFGSLALGALFGDSASAETSLRGPLAPHPPQFAPKAKRVIHLFMNGGPSQVDTFDPKPMLAKYAGQAIQIGRAHV